MPFPLIPVLVTAGIGSLGYVLFKPDAAPASGGGAAPAPAPAPAPTPSAGPKVPPAGVKNLPNTPNPAPAPAPAPTPIAPVPFIPPPPGLNNLPLPIAPPPLPLPIAPVQPTPPAVQPTSQTGVIIAPSGLNLRNAPNTSATVLYGMIAGTRVKILSLNAAPTSGAPNGWYNVTAPNGMTGWASAQYIQPDNGSNPVPVPIPIPTAPATPVIPANLLGGLGGLIPGLPATPTAGLATGLIGGQPGANLRSSPSTSGAIVKGLTNGTIVQVLSTTLSPPTDGAPQGWVNVKDASGSSGWVSRQFCTPLTGSFGSERFMGRPATNYRRRTAIKA